MTYCTGIALLAIFISVLTFVFLGLFFTEHPDKDTVPWGVERPDSNLICTNCGHGRNIRRDYSMHTGPL